MKVNLSKRKKILAIGISTVVIITVLVYGNVLLKQSSNISASSNVKVAADLVIQKSEVSEQATFYPVQAGKINIEVMAVKADDGTIRTAFNTCQICFNSGKGLYVQEGAELVCQTCGNRFDVNEVEVAKDGCNPVPIMVPEKIEDLEKIVIDKEFLTKNKELFLS